jgi:hypothetical protein
MPSKYRVWIANQNDGMALFVELTGDEAIKARKMANAGDYEELANEIVYGDSFPKAHVLFERKFDCEVELS